MNIYENYISELLNEDKPIGAKNRELWQNYLEKRYMSRDDIEEFFVTFVSEDKVGINPKSIWDTPNGVYAYPVSWALDNQIPFRGQNKPKKIKVIKIHSKKVLSNKLSKNEYQEKIKQLQKEYGLPDKQINGFVEDAKVQTYFGKLWNVTRMIAKHLKNEKTSNIWTTILLHLGYDVVIDNGDGVVHEHEKTQAVFLSPKSYKLVGEEFVDTEERFSANNKYFSIRFLEDYLKNNNARNIYLFLINNIKNILKLSEDGNKISIFIRLMKAIFVDIYNDNQKGALRLLEHFRPFITKLYKAVGINDFSTLEYIPTKNRKEFIDTYEDIFSDKVFKNLVKGNNDILKYIDFGEFVEMFSDTIETALKAYEVLWLDDNTSKDEIIKIYKKYKELFKDIYEHDPDLIPFDYIKDMIEKDS
jgi:hypothetical protein